jgi:hypothetical protein
MPQLDRAREGQHRDGGHDRRGESLHGDDDPPLREAIGYHPAEDRESEEAEAEPGSDGRQGKGLSSSASTWNTMTMVHMPVPKTSIPTAANSSR